MGCATWTVFFAQLQFEYKTQLYRRKSLIILDEIQLFPQARQALKTLLEDGTTTSKPDRLPASQNEAKIF